MDPYWNYVTPDGGQDTTDAWTDVEFVGGVRGERTETILARTSGPIGFHLVNTDAANVLSYRVIGSNEASFADTDWALVVAVTDIAANTVTSDSIDLARLIHYKLQVKSKVSATPANLKAAVAAKRF